MIGAPIFVGFATLAALLCWILIYSRGHWAIKATVTLAVLGFSFAVWSALGSYGGWPVKTTTPPQDALFVNGYAVEPNQFLGIKGAIYLWLVPRYHDSNPLGYKATNDEPRAYRLPFSQQNEKAVMQATAMQKKGAQVALHIQKSKKGHHSSGGAYGGNRAAFVPYKLPPVQLPRKG